MSDYVDELIEMLVKDGEVAREDIEPCTPEEIAEIEKVFAVKLPETYKMFLAKMGRYAGDFFCSTSFFYPEILDIRESSKELIKVRHSPFRLKKVHFVFINHQGAQFMFFDTTAGDDPPIYDFKMADITYRQVNDSFSNWLRLRVEEHIMLVKSINS